MTEKRFKTSCSFTIRSGNNPICKCMTDNGEYKSYSEWVDLLNELNDENEQLKQQVQKIHKLIDENIRIYEDTITNDDFLQIQLDTKLQTLYNLRKELSE